MLALDQSTSITGVAIGDSSKDLRSYQFGSIHTPKRPAFGERLAFLFEKLDALIRSEKPDLIVRESIVLMLQGQGGVGRPNFTPASGFLPAEQAEPAREAHTFNADVMKKLVMVAGTIDCLAGLHGIPCEEVAAASWRKVALGAGRAPKGSPPGYFKRAMKDRARQLSYPVKDDNEADAIGILLWAICGPQADTRKQGDLLALAGNL